MLSIILEAVSNNVKFFFKKKNKFTLNPCDRAKHFHVKVFIFKYLRIKWDFSKKPVLRKIFSKKSIFTIHIVKIAKVYKSTSYKCNDNTVYPVRILLKVILVVNSLRLTFLDNSCYLRPFGRREYVNFSVNLQCVLQVLFCLNKVIEFYINATQLKKCRKFCRRSVQPVPGPLRQNAAASKKDTHDHHCVHHSSQRYAAQVAMRRSISSIRRR